MLRDFWEDFVLLIPVRTVEEDGGVTVTFTEGTVFRGVVAVTRQSLNRDTCGDTVTVEEELLHEGTVILPCGAPIRRVRDQTLYRVAGDDNACRTPGLKETSSATVPVRRVVRTE